MFWKLSIKWRIMLPIIFSICAIFILISSYNYVVMRAALTEQVELRLVEISNSSSKQIAGFINLPANSIRALKSASMKFRNVKEENREHLSSFAAELLKNHPESVGIWISSDPGAYGDSEEKYKKTLFGDSSGRLNIWWTLSKGVLTQETPSEYEEEKDEDYFLLSKDSGKDQLIEPYIDEVGGEKILMTSFTTGVFEKGKYLATAGIDLALSEVQQEVSKVSPYPGARAYLISQNLKYLSHPNNLMLGKELDPQLEAEYGIAAKIKSGKDFFVEQDDFLTIFYPVSFKGIDYRWYLMLDVPYSEIFKEINRNLMIQIASMVIAILLIVFIVFLISRQIAERLQSSSSSLRQSADKIGEASKNLSGTSNELSAATAQQAASVEETSASLEEISGMVENNVTNAEEAYNLAMEVKTSTEKGTQSMGSLQTAMGEIKNSNQRIEKLVDAIENIAAKTAVMDEIVFQTKLLSFNASVEAERAGEHGRGFAVVAQEVGNLAAMTGKSAQEISVIVKESIDEAKKVTIENNEKVELGDKYALEMSDHLETIKRSTESVAKRSRQVLDASKEQSVGIKQINTAMSEVDKANQVNSSMADQTAASSDQLSNQTKVLNTVVSDINTIVDGESE